MKKLVNHPKYCRLSKQPGGLCARMFNAKHCRGDNGGVNNILAEDWDHCPRKKKQTPELASSMYELLNEATEIMSEYIDVAFTKKDIRNILEVFANKVQELK